MDPVTLAVLNGRIEQIADEMDATLFRSAFTPTIAEAHDACHGLYDAESGATLVQGKSGLPVFVGTMAFAVRAVIEKTRQAPAADGDIYLFNDAYDGGTHFNRFQIGAPLQDPRAARARSRGRAARAALLLPGFGGALARCGRRGAPATTTPRPRSASRKLLSCRR